MYKQAIKKSFSRAASSYSLTSFVQQEAARLLIDALYRETGRRDFHRILDVGCGNGETFLEFKKTFDTREAVLVDISRYMLLEAQKRVTSTSRGIQFINLDMETLGRAFRQKSFDVVISNSALHWASSFSETLKGIRDIMAPGGFFACSVFTRESLEELDRVLAKITGMSTLSRGFSPCNDVLDALENYFVPVSSLRLVLFRSYRDVFSLLRNLKHSGVSPSLWSQGKKALLFRRDFRRMDDEFNIRYCGVVVSYEIVIFTGKPRLP